MKNKFFGWVVSLSLLGVVGQQVLTRGALILWDVRVRDFFATHRIRFFIKLCQGVTLLGNWQIAIAAAVFISLLFWRNRKRKFLLPLWVTLVGNLVLSLFVKMVVHRPRPEGFEISSKSHFSFPSGHAATAVAFYGFLTYTVWRNTKGAKKKIASIFFMTLLVGIIGLSRLYLGVHYLTDVLGGYLIGYLWLSIGIEFSESRNGSSRAMPESGNHG